MFPGGLSLDTRNCEDAEENLNAKDAEDDEERAADEDDVSNWTQRWQQSLYHKLQARSSTDNPAAAAAQVSVIVVIILKYLFESSW